MHQQKVKNVLWSRDILKGVVFKYLDEKQHFERYSTSVISGISNLSTLSIVLTPYNKLSMLQKRSTIDDYTGPRPATQHQEHRIFSAKMHNLPALKSRPILYKNCNSCCPYTNVY